MSVQESSNTDAILGSVYLMVKFIAEASLASILKKIDPEDPMYIPIKEASEGSVSEDSFASILMGYCISEEGSLKRNMNSVMSIINKQVIALESNSGGQNGS